MIKDFKPRHKEEYLYYSIEFTDEQGDGFSFPCDENGILSEDVMSEGAKENYKYCISHPEKFARFNRVVRNNHVFAVPASGICDCGTWIELIDEYYGACECPNCGQWWNLFGQKLNPPEMWEETFDEEY